MTDGIIHSFQKRRQLESDLAALATTRTEAELTRSALAIVRDYPVNMVLGALGKQLGVAGSQLRGGLGQIYARLPAAEAAPALRAVVADRTRTPQERTTAALLLERYLNEAVSPALLSDLAGVDDVAFQSLLEGVEEGRRNRHVLLEYVTQMQQHLTEVAYMVLGMLDRLPPNDSVDLLRLIAQDERPQVAHAALERLVALAAKDDGALRALHTLTLTLPPKAAAQAERAQRKLQFSGRRWRPHDTDAWRALISPSDAAGYFSVWLVRRPSPPPVAGGEPEEDGVLLGFVFNLTAGVVQFSGHTELDAAALPADEAIGRTVVVKTATGPQMLLVTALFDTGRALLQLALAVHFAQEQPAPLSDDYKLWNDLIWEFESPHLQEAEQHLWDAPLPGAEETAPSERLAESAIRLLAHPVMESWTVWGSRFWSALYPVEAKMPTQSGPVRGIAEVMLQRLSQSPDQAQMQQMLTFSLRVQALWFHVAGEPQLAEDALLHARWSGVLPFSQNVLLEEMLLLGHTLRSSQGPVARG